MKNHGRWADISIVPGRSRFRSLPPWHLSSGCRRPRLAARRRALQHRQRSCPCRLGHIDPRLRPTASDARGAHCRYTRDPLADSIMYREALAKAAKARGWSVHWYDRETVFHEAKAVAGTDDLMCCCARWVGHSGRPGSPHTSLQQRRRSRRQAPELTPISPEDSLAADFNRAIRPDFQRIAALPWLKPKRSFSVQSVTINQA